MFWYLRDFFLHLDVTILGVLLILEEREALLKIMLQK